jgi:hypothetical protein
MLPAAHRSHLDRIRIKSRPALNSQGQGQKSRQGRRAARPRRPGAGGRLAAWPGCWGWGGACLLAGCTGHPPSALDLPTLWRLHTAEDRR